MVWTLLYLDLLDLNFQFQYKCFSFDSIYFQFQYEGRHDDERDWPLVEREDEDDEAFEGSTLTGSSEKRPEQSGDSNKDEKVNLLNLNISFLN